MKFSFGFDPSNFHYSTGDYPTENTCGTHFSLVPFGDVLSVSVVAHAVIMRVLLDPQVFRISPRLVCATYVRIDLNGRHQTQAIDNLFYTCIRYVRVRGIPIGASSLESWYHCAADKPLHYAVGSATTPTLTKCLANYAARGGAFDELKEDPDEFRPENKPKVPWPKDVAERIAALQCSASSIVGRRGK